MDAITLSIFASRIAAVCDEMGAVLQRAAFSPNIRDRLDFSCAVFDAEGELCAQAAHIPVHLGSMAYAMRDIVSGIQWQDGDMVIVNDPFLGGTHLPDVTVIAPVFVDGNLLGFVANRAHHADIGSDSPGSMPVSSSLEEEGVIIPPTHLVRAGVLDESVLNGILGQTRSATEGRGDFAAQLSANRNGVQRLVQLIQQTGREQFIQALAELNNYGERLASEALANIPDGEYRFSDLMDDDGLGNEDIPIEVCLRVAGHQIEVDFSGTAAQTRGNINCPLSVAAAAVYYVFRCLMPEQTPACAGTFRTLYISVPEGCLVNARRPAAVAAGNVETSTRLVDVVMGALAQALPDIMPAASHGSMNNLAMGGEIGGGEIEGEEIEGVKVRGGQLAGRSWDYYETMGGGMGAGPLENGLSGVQTHMTNTRNTPIEVLESRYPVRLRQYRLRIGSGGTGKHVGGDGLLREFEFLASANATLLTERRRRGPWGLNNGEAGKAGLNQLNGKPLPPKINFELQAGDRLTLASAGGGGWGKPKPKPEASQ